MDSKICFILFGIIILSDGKPTTDESSFLITNENELQQLLKTLYSDGKFDIAFSHHEDSPKAHHEDTARITHHDENSHASHHHHVEATHDHSHEEPHRSHTHTDTDGHPSLTNIQTLNLFLRKKPKSADDNDYDDAAEDSLGLRSDNNVRSVSSVDQVINLLNELEKKVGADNRCEGDRCGRGRANDNDRDDDDRDDDDRDDDNLDESGRLGRSGLNDREHNDDSERIACIGDSCGRIDLVGEDRVDEDDERSNNNNGNLGCFGEACGRADQSVEDRADCVGDKCGGGRDDDGNDRDDDDDNTNIARCFGDACGIDQTILRERRLPDGDPHLKQQFLPQAERLKINDDIDAIVINLSSLKSVGSARGKQQNDNERSKVQLFRNIDLSNLFEDKNDGEEEPVKSQYVLNSESKPIKAVVVDLSKAENDLTNQIKGLMKNIQTPLKQYKPIKVRAISKENTLTRGESKILPHNEDNNNVYVPKWLLDEVVAKTSLRDSEQNLKNLLPLTAKQKEKLVRAIAIKNKNASKRIFRRSIEDDVGVPFHLQIEGLGQVEA